MTWHLNWGDWFNLFTHFCTLSLLSFGGAITTIPEAHRFLVNERSWLTDPQFAASIAIAQAAPGPNLIFIPLMGWTIGMNNGGFYIACITMVSAMLGILLPSSMLTFFATRWLSRNTERRAVQAFKAGLVPVTLAMIIATGWILASSNKKPTDWPFWLLSAAAALLVWRTKIHLLWVLAFGAVVGIALA